MNRRNIFLLFLINLLLMGNVFTGMVIGMQNPKSSISSSYYSPYDQFTPTDNPASYVGVRKNDSVVYDAYINEDGLDAVKTDIDTLKEQTKDYLGSYGDLNTSAALDKALTNITSTIFSSGWETMNVTEIIKATLIYNIERLNTTYPGMSLPVDWENSSTYNLINLTEDILKGVGAETMTIHQLIDVIVDYTGILPENWETMNMSRIMIWLFGEALNRTIFDGNLPEDWEDFNITRFISHAIPGLEEQFVEYMIHFGMGRYMYGYVASDFPLNWTIGYMLKSSINMMFDDTYLASDILTWINITFTEINATIGIIPSDWQTAPISEYIENGLLYANELWKNATLQPGFLDNMTAFFDSVNFMLNMTFPEEFLGTDMGIYYENMTQNIIQSLNNSLYYLIPDWERLTLNQLVDTFYSYFTDAYNDFKDWLSNYGTIPINFFDTLKVKVSVEEVFEELTQTYCGRYWNGTDFVPYYCPPYTPVNLSISLDIGTGYQDPLFLPVRVYDPADGNFTSVAKYLAYQTFPSFMLLISNATDQSKILFKNQTIDLPDPAHDLTLLIDWYDNGQLKVAKMIYGSETLIAFEGPEIPSDGDQVDAIPGFELSLLLLVGSVSTIGLIYVIRKKKIKT